MPLVGSSRVIDLYVNDVYWDGRGGCECQCQLVWPNNRKAAVYIVQCVRPVS